MVRVFTHIAVIVGLYASVVAPARAGEVANALGLRPEASEPGPARRYAVSIVIDDLGLDEAATRAAIDLPAPLTLSFLPYGRRTTELAREAARAGHEVFLHLPMEPKGLDDPGPGVLTSWDGPATLIARAETALARVPGASGFNNHMGSRFTACAACVAPLADWAVRRNLFVLDSVTHPKSRLAASAAAAGARVRRRDVFLDHDPSRRAIDVALLELERIARREGSAVAIGHPKRATLDALDAWLATASDRGVDVAPVTGRDRDRPERSQRLVAQLRK